VTGLGLSPLFDTPFFEGIGVTQEVPHPFTVAIGGHSYFIDTEKYERATVDILRQAYDQQGEPGDQSLSIEGYWKRTQSDWTLGAGQEFLDDGGTRERFWTSKGIDPWTRRKLCLLHDTENKRASANSNLYLAKLRSGSIDYLYVSDGNSILRTADPTPASPSFTTITGTPGASVSSITTDGRTLWVAYGASGVYASPASGTTATQLSTVTTTLVRFANSRLIAANGAELFEILASGVKSTVMTHYNTNFAWAAITGAPTGVFAAGNSEDYGQFYFIGYNSELQQLSTPIPAGRLPDGERVHSLGEYGGVIVIGTSRGIRLGQIVDGRGIAPGPLIDIGHAVGCLEFQDDEVWFGWSSYDTINSGLGRAKLSRFSSTLVPAYASDLMANVVASTIDVATFGDRRYFTMGGSGLWGETLNYVTSGELDTGWMNFSTPEPKVATNLEIRHEPLAGTVSMTLVDETGLETDLGTSSTASSLGPVSPWTARAVRGEFFRIIVTLNRSTGTPTTGPCLRRWTLRSVVAPTQVEAFVVPVLLYERVDSDMSGGHYYPYDPLEEWDYLKGLEESRSPTTYQEGTRSYLVTVRSVGIPQGAVRGWNSDRGFFNATVYVRLVTLDVGSN
jgi:hypothetical protein